jgi:hypothetical protein
MVKVLTLPWRRMGQAFDRFARACQRAAFVVNKGT